MKRASSYIDLRIRAIRSLGCIKHFSRQVTVVIVSMDLLGRLIFSHVAGFMVSC